MKRIAVLIVTVAAGVVGAKPQSPPALPTGAVKFQGTVWTQSVSIVSGRNSIVAVKRDTLEAHWRTSGGMVGVTGVTSDKYKLVPVGGKTWVDTIQVTNNLGYLQPARAIVRSYPDGSRFDDVLSYKGRVFEHRVRIKRNGAWRSSVIFTDIEARPPGYTGLKQSCSSCHDQAGTGGYGTGLVPGGDGVIGDPLDWGVLQ